MRRVCGGYPEENLYSKISNKLCSFLFFTSSFYIDSIHLSLASPEFSPHFLYSFQSILLSILFSLLFHPFLLSSPCLATAKGDAASALITTCLTDSLHCSFSVSVKSLITLARKWSLWEGSWWDEEERSAGRTAKEDPKKTEVRITNRIKNQFLKAKRQWIEDTTETENDDDRCASSRYVLLCPIPCIPTPIFHCSLIFPCSLYFLEAGITTKRPLPGRFTATLFRILGAKR